MQSSTTTQREQQLEKALKLLMKLMSHGRPSDPRDCSVWDRAIEKAESILETESPVQA